MQIASAGTRHPHHHEKRIYATDSMLQNARKIAFNGKRSKN
jgi:hypothetical protein